MSKAKILLTLFLAVICQMVMAQGTVISGTVEDAMGPVMMANVVERDGNNRIVNATQTDMMGNFSMEIKNPKNKLVVSYVGSKTYVAVIGDKTSFAIKLEDEKTTLTEITVRGRRTTAGGLNIDNKEISVAKQTFNLEDVEGMAFTSVDEALQGEIAGLDIVANSGNLGSGTTMRLRGVSTINGNANPLIVVDDKPFENPDESFDFENATEEQFSSLLAVNVDDIASIDVLKDAAATAIWGNKGANGVIMIKTKRGKIGKPRLNFSYKFTGTYMPSGYDLLSGDQYTMMLKEELYNPSQGTNSTRYVNEINYDSSWGDYQNWNNNTDWVKAITQFGTQQEYNINISGGGEKAAFRISGGYNRQTGTIIKQSFDRFTTRLVLDYNVSDRIRFSTNFALTYTGNNKNNTAGSSAGTGDQALLAMAQRIAPNMSIYRQDRYGNDTDEYFIPYAAAGSDMRGKEIVGNMTSYEMAAVRAIGNPVAYANLAWKKQQTYNILPDFNLKYELLGIENGKTRLTFNGRVFFDIYAQSVPTYMPGSLNNVGSADWNSQGTYNQVSNSESNQIKVGTRWELIFTPAFKNEDFYLTMLGRYETNTSKYTSQSITQSNVPNGISSSTVDGKLGNMSSSSSRGASHAFIYNMHASYKSRYSLGFSLRADGDSKFGPKNPWFYSPSVSMRYNVSEEKFFEPLRKVVSMLGITGSWGITGSSSASDYLFYNTYTSNGTYGTLPAQRLDGLMLDDLRPQKKTGLNLGVKLGLFNDLIDFDLNIFKETTKDLQQKTVTIPSVYGYPSIANANVGELENRGWDLNVSARKFIKKGKFSMSATFNISQTVNELKSMNETVLNNMNKPWTSTDRAVSSYIGRVEVGKALGSIYGFKFKGVYQYSYDYLENLNLENMIEARNNPSFVWNAAKYEEHINNMLAEGKTLPVRVDENGKVVMNSDGTPQRMVYDYTGNGTQTYKFNGGDAIYEDINKDGQINEYDICYLGNSLPKLQGGFSLTFQYGDWKLVSRFNYRWGNNVVNWARASLEKMIDTGNQCSTTTYRWRKEGDVTYIPRAMYNTAYNFQGSDRFVEDGSFLRLNNIQVSYNVPKKMIKKYGLNTLSLYFSMNNLFCLTHYSGIDPEINPGTFGMAIDNSQTPRAKSFTASINIGF